MQGILGHRADHRNDENPHHDPGRGGVEDLDDAVTEDRSQQRGHERQGEVPVDDGRDACQDFENRLEDAPGALRGVLTEVDGGGQADRQGDRHGDGTGDEGGQHERPDPEVENGRLPRGRGQELAKGHVFRTKEEQGFLAELVDDSDRRNDRDGGSYEERPLDEHLEGTGPFLESMNDGRVDEGGVGGHDW